MNLAFFKLLDPFILKAKFWYINSIWWVKYFGKGKVILHSLVKELLPLFVNTFEYLRLKNDWFSVLIYLAILEWVLKTTYRFPEKLAQRILIWNCLFPL